MSKNTKKIFPIPLGINWHEGMLLSQHHFQQNDLRHFHILTHQIRLLSSNHFGVCHLRIDNVALPDGIYRINEIEAVFPDGLIYSFFPSSELKLKHLEINVAEHMKNGETEKTINLVIAESAENSSPLLGNPARFYTIDGALVKDDNVFENEVKIPRLFPNAFLHIGETLPELCIGFPLCKIICIDGVFHVKNWTPPCFFIERHFPLWKRCSMLALSVREKAVFLSEKLKTGSSSGASSVDTEFLLRQILTILPGLEAIVFSDHIRPYELYSELAEVLGAVSSILPYDIIPVMQPYDHNNIDATINPIISLIEHYLSAIERGYSVSLFNKKERFFYKYITEEELKNCVEDTIYIGIRGSSMYSFSDIENWINDAIIVSDFAIENVREKRVKGAKRSVMKDYIISKIMPSSGVMMFEISIDKSFIKSEQNLHIFNPGDSSDKRPVEIMMFVQRT